MPFFQIDVIERLPGHDITSVLTALQQANTPINIILKNYSPPPVVTNGTPVRTKAELESFFPEEENKFKSSVSSENLMSLIRNDKKSNNSKDKDTTENSPMTR